MPQAPTLDLDGSAFSDACRQLSDRVTAGFHPEVVIGIATGGVYVAEAMVAVMDQRPQLASIRLSRPSTKVKERIGAGRMLRRLPEPVANQLRRVEVNTRERFVSSDASLADLGLELHEVMEDDSREAVACAQTILVVDDTVDSGKTLNLARQAISAVSPAAEVRTAVITSTFKKPPVRPDYCLYERTLIRFHWSFDS